MVETSHPQQDTQSTSPIPEKTLRVIDGVRAEYAKSKGKKSKSHNQYKNTKQDNSNNKNQPQHSNSDNTKIIEILKYWRLVEFFTPYNLRDVIYRSENIYQIPYESLTKRGNEILPWLSATALQYSGGQAEKCYCYNIYLLPFDKARLVELSKQLFPLSNSPIAQIEFEERLDDEGDTCFAKLRVDQHGCFSAEQLSVSTLPWGIGQLLKYNGGKLDFKHYDYEQMIFDAALLALKSQLNNPSSALIDDFVAPNVLTVQGLHALITILQAWSGYTPENPIAAIIELVELKNTKALEELDDDEQDKQPDNQATNQQQTSTDSKSTEKKPDEKPDKKPQEEQTRGSDILNSFYIRDLEHVINQLRRQQHNGIKQYILGNPYSEYYDLYKNTNTKLLDNRLAPTCTPMGRWPNPSAHSMSLMQQFAINTVCRRHSPDSKLPLFSVNGPPGTGKTTLLQDIIAHNVVARAEALATFDDANKTLVTSRTIQFDQQTKFVVHELAAELTGFEMVVASSNNAAVENISKELPLARKVADEFVAGCNYLAPVAAKLFAQHKQGKILPLQADEQPWGLVAVALGNSRNRKRFVEQAFFTGQDVPNSILRVKDGEYLTLWEWRKQYTGPSFLEAREDFLKAKQNFEKYQSKIIELHELSTCHCEEQSTHCHSKRRSPHSHCEERSGEAIQEEIQNLKSELDGIVIPTSLDKHSDDTLDNSLDNNLQFASFWQNEQLNTLRSECFITAMNLHQAWLYEVMKSGKFHGNLFAICKLLGNRKPVHLEDEIILWQSLFMWVPVVSTTFASFGMQFKNVGAKQLGTLMIDEAGQALPQAAVGAIWRANNIVVVGDPLQIEPVFTTPANLVDGLAEHCLDNNEFNELSESGEHTDETDETAEPATPTNTYIKWLPTQTTVQSLADAANPIGAAVNVAGQQYWIGCPLRVHRRCIEPMFSLANKIAYENKMLNARANFNHANNNDNNLYWLGESCWYDVSGSATDKQFVPEQAQLVLELFCKLYMAANGLPKLYIITPFKQVKRQLQALIRNSKNWAHMLDLLVPLPKALELYQWTQDNIGTVHTFQGKENETVIVVLGVDYNNQGAASWASNKPNLLNVALTRARDRIYFIGDYGLWSSRPYFREVAEVLERKETTVT